MSNPPENHDKEPEKPDRSSEAPENMFKMLDDLLAHTNSSRRIFLIFIASALIFAPVALVMGGILIGHPKYSVFHLETSHDQLRDMIFGAGVEHNNTQFFIVEKNGSNIVRSVPFHPHPRLLHQDRPIFLGIQIFIFICLIFAAVLLFVALKEYRFFARWNSRYKRYKETQDKIDSELGKD
ncbi:MAG: hypothetical protein KGI33_11320 [Thaumarchaeota archaeon]|nr:hypothetical protein [Nitrososphaerota archaeon]